MIINRRGQSLIESLFVLPFAVTVVSFLTWVSYTYFAEYHVDYWLYQSSLCLQREIDWNECKMQLSQQIEQLPFYKIIKLDNLRNPSKQIILLEYSSPLLNLKSKRLEQAKHLNQRDFEK